MLSFLDNHSVPVSLPSSFNILNAIYAIPYAFPYVLDCPPRQGKTLTTSFQMGDRKDAGFSWQMNCFAINNFSFPRRKQKNEKKNESVSDDSRFGCLHTGNRPSRHVFTNIARTLLLFCDGNCSPLLISVTSFSARIRKRKILATVNLCLFVIFLMVQSRIADMRLAA